MTGKIPELTTKLLPCPFCGSEPDIVQDRPMPGWMSVRCTNSVCLRPSTDWSRDQEYCAQTWNLRYKPVESR